MTTNVFVVAVETLASLPLATSETEYEPAGSGSEIVYVSVTPGADAAGHAVSSRTVSSPPDTSPVRVTVTSKLAAGLCDGCTHCTVMGAEVVPLLISKDTGG